MNNNSPNLFQFNLPRLQSWLTIVAICLLLGSLGLGWLVKSATDRSGIDDRYPNYWLFGLFLVVASQYRSSSMPGM